MAGGQIYKTTPAWVYTEDHQRYERAMTVQFRADSDREAVELARLWSINRQEVAEMMTGDPNAFLGSIKVYLENIVRPDSDGYIPNVSILIFEWKYDRGEEMEAQIERVCAKW
jgi:hypothetical protein